MANYYTDDQKVDQTIEASMRLEANADASARAAFRVANIARGQARKESHDTSAPNFLAKASAAMALTNAAVNEWRAEARMSNRLDTFEHRVLTGQEKLLMEERRREEEQRRIQEQTEEIEYESPSPFHP